MGRGRSLKVAERSTYPELARVPQKLLVCDVFGSEIGGRRNAGSQWFVRPRSLEGSPRTPCTAGRGAGGAPFSSRSSSPLPDVASTAPRWVALASARSNGRTTALPWTVPSTLLQNEGPGRLPLRP